MITVDTNVLIAFWDSSEKFSRVASSALFRALSDGAVFVSGIVYAEFLAGRNRTETVVDSFFESTGIVVQWALDEKAIKMAGRAFREYTARRAASSGGSPRRIIADFLIGAQAVTSGCSLLTLDSDFYALNYPTLALADYLWTP